MASARDLAFPATDETVDAGRVVRDAHAGCTLVGAKRLHLLMLALSMDC